NQKSRRSGFDRPGKGQNHRKQNRALFPRPSAPTSDRPDTGRKTSRILSNGPWISKCWGKRTSNDKDQTPRKAPPVPPLICSRISRFQKLTSLFRSG